MKPEQKMNYLSRRYITNFDESKESSRVSKD